MRGRPPKPVEQRRREGNPGKRPLPQTVLLAGRPELNELAEPPADLPKPGQELWVELAPTLVRAGLLDLADRFMFEELCRAHARRVQFSRALKEDGLFAIGSHGQIKQHPAVAGERAAAEEFRQLGALFGLSPVDRTRLGLTTLVVRSMEIDLAHALEDPNDPGFVDADAVDEVGLPGV